MVEINSLLDNRQKRRSYNQKQRDMMVNRDFLNCRTKRLQNFGYEKTKWIKFCEIMLQNDFHLSLYEAKKTASKYITVKRDSHSFKVRFSNHKPSHYKELAGDCDFFVGITHLGTTTTQDAINAVFNYFDNI